MNIPYPADIYVKDALRTAIKTLERTIENCGTLTHKDAKQSDAAKSYFKKQRQEAEDTIALLHEKIKQINT